MINQEKKSDLSDNPSTLPELSKLSIVETQFIGEYLNNGQNGTKAYLTVKPHVQESTARVEASEIVNRPHVQAYLDAYKTATISKSALTKDYLIDTVHWGIETAKANEDLNVLFKGAEVGAKLIHAYDTEADDLTKYTSLLNKISATNVQINIGCSTKDE